MELPFKSTNQKDLKNEIINFEFSGENINDPLFCDLLSHLFKTNPKERLTISQMMRHKYITNNGAEPLNQYAGVSKMELTEKDIQAAIHRKKMMTNIGIAVKLKVNLSKSRNKISKMKSTQ